MKWLLLSGAITIEVVASLCLKAALETPVFFLAAAGGYVAAFALLGAVLRRGLALGVAYGIWAASGVALTALLSALIFAEPLTGMMAGGITLVIGGVLCVELGSHRPAAPEEVVP